MAGFPVGEPAGTTDGDLRRRRFGRLVQPFRAVPRGTLLIAAGIGIAVMLLSLYGLALFAERSSRSAVAAASSASGSQGAPWPTHVPVVRSSELWYATTPLAGVWAELKVVLDNPLQAGEAAPTKTTLLLSGTLMEDFKIRSTEPKLLTQPRRRPDGRYALVFAAPIPESLNWFRIYLETRNGSPRPLSLGFMLDGTKNLAEQAPTLAQVFYVDRQADPFKVVPEPLVGWVPAQARSAFPVLVLYAAAIGTVAASGCIAAFWAVRR